RKSCPKEIRGVPPDRNVGEEPNMQEEKMKQVYTSLKLIAGATFVAAFAVAGTPASAQEPSASTSTSTTSTSTSTALKKPPQPTATPDMILEAIQRSQARTEKLNTAGKPEQFGSEEPFTFDPKK